MKQKKKRPVLKFYPGLALTGLQTTWPSEKKLTFVGKYRFLSVGVGLPLLSHTIFCRWALETKALNGSLLLGELILAKRVEYTGQQNAPP